MAGPTSTDTSAPTLWRVERAARRLAVAVALLFVLLATFLTAIGITPGGAVGLWLVAIAVMLAVWRWYLVPYVALQADDLEVQGVLSLRSVRYGAIRSVRPGARGLEVQTAKEGAVVIWAIQRSKISEWLHRESRADRVAAAIMERVASASP